MARCRFKTLAVVGGGTAGYMSALALRRWFPDLSITLIESSKIPVIGVGEATTPPIVSFLHNFLGIDVHDLMRVVKPTWKVGIRFEWGAAPFNYPFTPGAVDQAFVNDQRTERASIGSLLMTAGKAPLFDGQEGIVSALKQIKFAYHLDNRPFALFLRELAISRGIPIVDAVVSAASAASAETGATNAGDPAIASLVTDSGERLSYDFYLDCTGFRSLLMGGALESSWVDYSSSLFCDSAVFAGVPNPDGINSYTLAETMDHGWCWTVPMIGENHRGYVFSSAHVSRDDALAEMRRKNPAMGEPKFVRYRSGRREHFVRNNVAAIGNSYGFVEPLESTALHMVITELVVLARFLDLERSGTDEHDPTSINQSIGGHWDYLRWFLAIHYRFNNRLETPFWRACRETVNTSGLEDVLEDYRKNGPLTGRWQRPDDSIFGAGGLDIMLMGQGVLPGRAAGTANLTDAANEAWEARCQQNSEVVARAIAFEQALPILQSRPDLLDELVTDTSSWTHEFASILQL